MLPGRYGGLNLKLLPFISLFFVPLLANTSMAASVTPEKCQVTEVMNNYPLHNQNNSYQLACEIGQYVSSEYGWNCDIRQLNFTNHNPVYINVFYPAADNKKGYEAYYGWFGPQKKEVTGFWGKDKRMYYTDWYEPAQGNCAISGVCSFNIVKSYFGNVTDEYIIEPVVISDENNTTAEDVPVFSVNVSDSEEISVNNSSNITVQTVDLEGNNITNEVNDSINTVNNQGIIDTVKQYWFDFKNANLNNVTLNFWGN